MKVLSYKLGVGEFCRGAISCRLGVEEVKSLKTFNFLEKRKNKQHIYLIV